MSDAMPAAAPPMTGVLGSIRAATRGIHDRLEELPVTQEIVAETISRDRYAALLSQHYHLHLAFERDLPTGLALPRAPLALGDLRALDREPVPASEPTRALAARLSAWSSDGPRRLGVLYVFEGSRMGSAVIQRHLARALELADGEGHGLDFHRVGMESLRRDFGRIAGLLEASASQQDEVVDAARQTMEGIHAIYSELSAR